MELTIPTQLEGRIERVPMAGCWIWTGSTTQHGYGTVTFKGKQTFIHRVIYALQFGPIDKDLQIDHLCRVRSCCNPNHLEVVTRLENVRRSRNWQREKKICPNGHPYSGENLYIRPSNNGRECRQCRSEYLKIFKQRKRNAC